MLPRRGKKENAPVAIAEAGDAYRERLELVQRAMQSTLLEGERWMSRCAACRMATLATPMEEEGEGEDSVEHSSSCIGSAGEHRPAAEKIAVGDTSMLSSLGVVRVLVRKTRHLACVGRTIRMYRGVEWDEVEEEPFTGAEKRPVKGVLCLTPLEALHLVDRRVMLLLQQPWSAFEDVVPNGPFLSLSECYCLLLGASSYAGASPADVALLPFSVYSHLKKLGYVLFSAELGLRATEAEESRNSPTGAAALHRQWWPPLQPWKSSMVACFDTEAPIEVELPRVVWTPDRFGSFSATGSEAWLTSAAANGWSFFTVYPATKEFSRSKSQPCLLLACAGCTALDANLPLRAVAALIDWGRSSHTQPLPLALCLADSGLKLSFLSIEAGLAPPRPKASRRKKR